MYFNCQVTVEKGLLLHRNLGGQRGSQGSYELQAAVRLREQTPVGVSRVLVYSHLIAGRRSRPRCTTIPSLLKVVGQFDKSLLLRFSPGLFSSSSWSIRQASTSSSCTFLGGRRAVCRASLSRRDLSVLKGLVVTRVRQVLSMLASLDPAAGTRIALSPCRMALRLYS